MRKVIIALLLLLTVGSTSAFANGITPYSTPPLGDDVTSSFTKKMRDNALYIMYFAMNDTVYPLATGEFFASQVKTGGPWDYKLAYGPTLHWVYNGLDMTGEDLGNMHYGFVGRAAGFSTTILRTAAGAYQIYSGTAHLNWYSTYFDDPNDQKWITYGMNMWDNSSWPTSFSAEIDLNSPVFDNFTAEQKVEIESAPLDKDNPVFDALTDNQKREIEQLANSIADRIKAEQSQSK